MPLSHVIAIDQGTTSTRCIVFDRQGSVTAMAHRPLHQSYPKDGWVEHDPNMIWRDTRDTVREALGNAGVSATDIAALGITNQRETIVIWDRATGEPVYPAIVWQDRRTGPFCADLKREGAEELVRQRTGLLIDPYFSGTKINWILQNVPEARSRAERGELAAGTIDCFLLWRLTEGRVHATDATNAARTMLFDITRQCWDDDLLRMLDVPQQLLPDVYDNSCIFGACATSLFGAAIPIAGMAGDQQAALIGQCCFGRGQAKATYGTGCFALTNIGETPIFSSNRLLTTPAFRFAGRVTYAMEGSIFAAGAAMKWMGDRLGLIDDISGSGELAGSVADNHGVYVVPAFVGLGAPYWDSDARGLICGLTLDTGAAHLIRAVLESVGYQTRDLLDAMVRDGAPALEVLRIDGGMAANDWLCQFLSDILQKPVERPRMLESTALGAAFLAGLGTGFWPNFDALGQCRQLGRRFEPQIASSQRDSLLAGWYKAVDRALL